MKDLDVVEQIAACVGTRPVDLPFNTFLLQAAEGRLCYGIVPAAATPSRARGEHVRAAVGLRDRRISLGIRVIPLFDIKEAVGVVLTFRVLLQPS